ncbi:hypothetical protein HNR62_003218 [Oceanisphaera litoralis]|uniref:hypothetical protein n=1 Tax=Oceanisphaera litoralis TaxID=225144 RepID=UPI00195B843C|nr:hypothetical protein [Oceanisphaera litoralis]MBM7457306.1 hypothetical protein [Oceanisphaera litoralis]
MMEAFEILTGGLGKVKEEFGAVRQDLERRREFEGKKESPDYKACTIRLPVQTVYLLDAFAAECEMSRNDVVAILVNDSLSDAMYGFFGNESTAAGFVMEVDQAFESGLSWADWQESEKGGRK